MYLFLGTQNFPYEDQRTYLFPGRCAIHTHSSFHPGKRSCEQRFNTTSPFSHSACCHTVWLCSLSGSQGWRMWFLLQFTSSELGSRCHGNWEWNGAKHQPGHWAKVCGARKSTGTNLRHLLFRNYVSNNKVTGKNVCIFPYRKSSAQHVGE